MPYAGASVTSAAVSPKAAKHVATRCVVSLYRFVLGFRKTLLVPILTIPAK